MRTIKVSQTMAPTINVGSALVQGVPMRYVVKETGYLLYSVGENLADDGGMTYRERAEQERNGDIVFEVRR